MTVYVRMSIYQYMRYRAREEAQFKVALENIRPQQTYYQTPRRGVDSDGVRCGFTENLGSGCHWRSRHRMLDEAD
jgi:hypothetical protein